MSAESAPKLHTLDAMRGIAAFAVAAFHASFLMKQFHAPYIAVDFFFALSGFVIAHAYDRRLASNMGPAEFIGRRLLRLYPLFALGLLLGLAAAIVLIVAGVSKVSPGTTFLQFIGAMLFLPYPSVDPEARVVPLNGPYWSLILEIHINVIFALAFAWLNLRVLGVLVTASAMVLIGIAYLGGTLDVGFKLSEYFGGVARVAFSFGLGVVISRVRHRIQMPTLHWGVLLALTGLLLVFPTPPEIRWIYECLCVIVLFPLLILAGAQSQPSSSRVIGIFLMSGGASYALYAIHMPIFYVGRALAQTMPDVPFKVVMLPFLILACLLAVAADRFYDQPVRKALGAYLARRRKGSAAPKRMPLR